MPGFVTENLRAIALVGHSGAGKTTLAEALLLVGFQDGVGVGNYKFLVQ